MENGLLEAALAYAGRGWKVFPVRGKAPDGRLVAHGVLDATTDAEIIRRWWKIEPKSNIGVAIPAGTVVLDVDPRHGGDQSLDALLAAGKTFPQTVATLTGGGGNHFWFRGSVRASNGKLGVGLDIKSGNAYVLVPPSIHPDSHKRYEWLTGPDDCEMAEAPAWLAAHDAPAKQAAAIAEVIPEGQRDSTLASLAGTMRRRGMSEPAILAALREENTHCQPPLEDADVERIARSIARYEPAETLGRPVYSGPPSALSETLEAFHKWLHLPDEVPILAVLGAAAANMLAGDPAWLGLIAPPSSCKTEILNSLSLLRRVFPAATLTPAGLLSGTGKKEYAAGAKGGLLRQLGAFGILLMKDFGSILSMRPDAKSEILAALREIYDGSWTRVVGNEGGKVLTWQGKAGLLFGATPVIDRHTSVTGALGERFLLCRMNEDDDKEQARCALEHARAHSTAMRSEIAEATAALFANELHEPDELSEDEEEELIEHAALAVRLRSTVDRDPRTREVEYIHGAEMPARLVLTLVQLVAGLEAIGVERRTAMDVAKRVAMDSTPPLRKKALLWLREHGTAETTAVATALGLPTSTGKRALEDLAAYGLVQRHKSSGKSDLWEAIQ